MAQVFLGYNLLGQGNTSASITLAELYFMWCMKEQRKVHLGYWIAYTCRMIAGHAVRNLNICHILGEFLRRNLDIIYDGIDTPSLCPSPELFDIAFFVRTKMLKMVRGRYHFYKVDQADGTATPSTALAIEDRPRQGAELQEVEKAGTEDRRTRMKKTEEQEAKDRNAWMARMEAMMGQLVDNSRAQKELMEAHSAQITKAVSSLGETLKRVHDHLIAPTVQKKSTPGSSHSSSTHSRQRPHQHLSTSRHHTASKNPPPPKRK